jgi:hypothetical protein
VLLKRGPFSALALSMPADLNQSAHPGMSARTILRLARNRPEHAKPNARFGWRYHWVGYRGVIDRLLNFLEWPLCPTFTP